MPFLNLKDISEKELIPGYWVRFVHTDNMTFAYWTVKAGAALPEHNHLHEQVANVLEGEFELTIAGETRKVQSGEVAVIPSNTVHSGRAVSDCRILDVFHPVREDYL